MSPVPTLLPDGPKVRAMREGLGLTQKELGQKIHRSRMTVWSIEQGKPTGKHTMRRVGRILRINVCEITLPGESADEDGAEAEPDGVAA